MSPSPHPSRKCSNHFRFVAGESVKLPRHYADLLRRLLLLLGGVFAADEECEEESEREETRKHSRVKYM